MSNNDIYSFVFDKIPLTLNWMTDNTQNTIISEWKSRMNFAREKAKTTNDYTCLKQISKELISAAVSKQGKRDYMEDRIICKHNIMPSMYVPPSATVIPHIQTTQTNSVDSSTNNVVSMYAVLDGHGTDFAATYCKEHMPAILSSMLYGVNLNDKNAVSSVVANFFTEVDKELHRYGIEYFLGRGKFDRNYIRQYGANSPIGKIGGTTCTLLLLFPTFWLSANVGDSRTFLVNLTKDQYISTDDHTPNIATEYDRIKKAGFIVSNFPRDVPRVDGKMAVSRVLGDFEYKCYYKNTPINVPSFSGIGQVSNRQTVSQNVPVTTNPFMNNCAPCNRLYTPKQQTRNTIVIFPSGNKNLYAITSIPDIIIQDYKETDSYFCLASDGFFAEKTSEDLLGEINKYFLGGEFDLSAICDKVVNEYCSQYTTDNVTLILIQRNL